MKRAVAFISAFVILLMCIPAFASESETVGGVYTASVPGAVKAEAAGNTFYPSEPDGLTLGIEVNVSDIDNKNNYLYLGDKRIGLLKNGVNTFSVGMNELSDGENTFLIRCLSGSDQLIDDMVYGSYNIDDMVVISVVFTLPGETFVPAGMVKYLPTKGEAGLKEQRAAYAENTKVGDGWDPATGLGGSTPDQPVMLGYIYNKSSGGSAVFAIDTTLLPDGENEINFTLSDGGTLKKTLNVDNTPPEISFSQDGSNVSFEIKDASKYEYKGYIDGEAISGIKYNTGRLCAGGHSLYVTATDAAGNENRDIFLFNVAVVPTYSGDAESLSATMVKRINAYENRFGEAGMTSLRSENETLIPLTGHTTESAYSYTPYQAFVADIGDKDEVYISYAGSTSDGTRIKLSAYDNSSSSWVDIGYAESGKESGFLCNVKGFSQDGKLRVRAMPDETSGDTVMWISDTQYYSRYEDLYHLYEDDMNYAVKLHKEGTLSYVLHTGDLVDQTQAGDAEADKEYAVASRMQAILDDAGVPNGVVSGNHDVLHKAGDYKYYSKYFPASRYEGNSWYGGQYKNGTHHFDLVTVGGFRMLFLFIGCYAETDEGFLTWASEVLDTYPEYNAVLCTHEYLLPSGEWSGDRAEVIWNRLAVPHENVKMILCGHNDGVCNQWRKVEGSDRQVYEMLADYQFAELFNDVQHVENGCTCDGEGFVRMLKFDPSGDIIVSTYSPTFDDENYFATYEENFVVPLALTPRKISLTTSAIAIGVDIKSGNGDIAFEKYGDICRTVGVNASANEYDVPDETKDRLIEYARPEVDEFRDIAPTLKRGSNGLRDENSEIGLDLMPASIDKLVQTSGCKTKTLSPLQSGAFSLIHTGEGYNWVTLRNTVNKSFDTSEYDRLYFSVTAPDFTKWNLYVTLDGVELNFSQLLYEKFGYVHGFPPSDICGSWQGYIDISPYVTGKKTVQSAYFVVATPEREVNFDYFYFGKGTGDSVTFVSDENSARTFEYAKGTLIEAPTDPVRPGYTFEGWYKDAALTEKASFPVSASENDTYFAKFVENTFINVNEYGNTEVDIIEKTVYNNSVPVVAIAAGAAVILIAVLVIILKSKKKKV